MEMKTTGIGMLILLLSVAVAAQAPQRGPGQRGQRGGRVAHMDTDGDRKISKDEWKGSAEAFDRLDSDDDGFISAEEGLQARRGRGARGMGPGQMDTNGDQKISKDEWKGSAEAFDRLDSNDDGFITAEEGRQGRGGRGARGTRGTGPMDTNGDKRISRDEWKGPADRFDQLDANRDGFLTPDEMRQRRGGR